MLELKPNGSRRTGESNIFCFCRFKLWVENSEFWKRISSNTKSSLLITHYLNQQIAFSLLEKWVEMGEEKWYHGLVELTTIHCSRWGTAYVLINVIK